MDEKPADDQYIGQYKGHKIPFVIKLSWWILILWGIYYSFRYALPDLRMWLER